MTISRRCFLQDAAVAGAMVAAGGSSLSGCGNRVEAAPIADASINDDPLSSSYGQIAVVVPSLPDLLPVGGAVTLRLAPLPDGERPFLVPSGGVLLIHRAAPDDPPEFVAVSSSCPHAFCPLGYSAEDQLIECPCHGSRFRPIADPADAKSCAGQVVHLPARSGLAAWDVLQDPDGITVYVDLTSQEECNPLPVVVNGKVELPLSDFPALAAVGGSVVGQSRGLLDTLVVIRTSDTAAVTLSAVCTHAGCTVAYSAAQNDLECPCHGSKYDLLGNVTAPPAMLPLKTYPTAFDGVKVTITVP